MGFRPLSGSYISQCKARQDIKSRGTARFRPLSGSYISQYFPKSFLVSLESFRPLSGSYISQLLSQILSKPVIQFPSPIGELHFSIMQWIDGCVNELGFRPLSGSYISQ